MVTRLEELTELMEKLQREAREGGELKDMPCPMCGRPRSQRSDYIRCTPCATNWLAGEDRTKDPRLSREPYLSWKINQGGARSANVNTGSQTASFAGEKAADADEVKP